ncbi:MAG TPA: Fur family transcriptional regulator [Actinomycetota bacterium]|jgi:Fur family ferric uptake transcriptional regulator
MTAGPMDDSDRLRVAGLRITAPRLAVLRAAMDHPHADVEALALSARVRIGTVSTQAIYDASAALVRAGLLRRIEPAGSPARYEARVGDNHHHGVCRICGTIVDVDCAVGAAPCLQPSAADGFVIDEAEVTFWGLCKECRSEAKEPEQTP